MDIRIPLSLPYASTYEEILMALSQLELAIHYAQKSVKSAKESGLEISGDSFIVFDFDGLPEDVKEENLYVLEHPSIRINLDAV